MAVPQLEPQHLKQVSNANEIALEFNRFIAAQDFELNDIQDLPEVAADSIIIEQIQSKLGQQWNDQKRQTVHQSLQQYVEQSQLQSLSKDDRYEPRATQRSERETNADILNQIVEIAQLKDRNTRSYPSEYKDIRFSDYHFEHLAQFIYDDTEHAFNQNGKICDLYMIVVGHNINGKTLTINLDENYIRNTFNNNIKRATIKYIIDANNNGEIDENWDCEQVFEFLYFAECSLIRNATRSLQIDGKTFIMIGTKEWSKRLKQLGIPLSISQPYYVKIETHKMNTVPTLQRNGSDSMSIKYEEELKTRNINHFDKVEPKHVGFSTDGSVSSFVSVN